jgi:hypothetical protein
MVMNFRVPYNEENCLTSWGTGSFSRKNVMHGVNVLQLFTVSIQPVSRIYTIRKTDAEVDCLHSYSSFYPYCYSYSYAYTCSYCYYSCYLHCHSRSCSCPYFVFSIIQIHISLIRPLPLRICPRFFSVHLGNWRHNISKKSTAASCYILAKSFVTNNRTINRCHLILDNGNSFK